DFERARYCNLSVLHMVEHRRNLQRRHTEFAREENLGFGFREVTAVESQPKFVVEETRGPSLNLPLSSWIAEKRGAHDFYRRPSHKHIANVEDDVHLSPCFCKLTRQASQGIERG